MKCYLTFKTPDVLDQLEELSENELKKVKKILNPFLEYDEYIYLEIDTDEKTVKLDKK